MQKVARISQPLLRLRFAKSLLGVDSLKESQAAEHDDQNSKREVVVLLPEHDLILGEHGWDAQPDKSQEEDD